MNFEIQYFDDARRTGMQSFFGKLEAAVAVATTGMILHKATRATISDASTGEVLKEIGR